MYPFTLPTTRFKHSIWDLSSSFPGGKRTIHTFRQDDGLGKGSFAFPAHLAVRRGSDLSTIVSERGAKGGGGGRHGVPHTISVHQPKS
jgi:hypothetical protein